SRQARGNAGSLLTRPTRCTPARRRPEDMIPTTLLSPEARLLLHSMEPAPDMATVSALLQDPQFDWDCLVNLAQKEKATTSLSNMLRRVPRDAMPPERAAQV